MIEYGNIVVFLIFFFYFVCQSYFLFLDFINLKQEMKNYNENFLSFFSGGFDFFFNFYVFFMMLDKEMISFINFVFFCNVLSYSLDLL